MYVLTSSLLLCMSSDEVLEVGIFPMPVSMPSPVLPGVQPMLGSACSVAVDDMTTAVSVSVSIPLLVNHGTSLPSSLAVASFLGLPTGVFCVPQPRRWRQGTDLQSESWPLSL